MAIKLSNKDLGLLKGALRRAFARSDIHQQVEATNRTSYYSSKNPRCLKWSWCTKCGVVTPTWKTAVDHISPVVPLNKTLVDMTPHEILDGIWCTPSNLQVLCLYCHNEKSKIERASRPKRKKKG